MVWSNLYKIAPAEGRNPNNEECKWQLKFSAALVRKELDEIKPKFCIVLTNNTWWKYFCENLKTKILQQYSKQNDGIIESVEKYGETQIIVTKRPFLGGKSDEYVNETLKIVK
ncbi:MAG: hypothetical protein QM594_03745 [Niabella sp.]